MNYPSPTLPALTNPVRIASLASVLNRLYCALRNFHCKLIEFTALPLNSVPSLLANIDSFDDGMATEDGADKTKGLFARFTTTTTTTSTTGKPFLTLVLGINSKGETTAMITQ